MGVGFGMWVWGAAVDGWVSWGVGGGVGCFVCFCVGVDPVQHWPGEDIVLGKSREPADSARTQRLCPHPPLKP